MDLFWLVTTSQTSHSIKARVILLLENGPWVRERVITAVANCYHGLKKYIIKGLFSSLPEKKKKTLQFVGNPKFSNAKFFGRSQCGGGVLFDTLPIFGTVL
jgi:hypothetical protein